jgi:Zn-dependent oligopeptidase
MDSIVYNTFVTKFNEEYSESLNESQKALLGNYISSFQDNGIDLKVYLNEEIGRLKNKLTIIKEENQDSDLKEKIGRVYTILDETKNKDIDTETLEIVLSTQQLLEDLENDD